ncbi:MAG: metallophosphoesterase [Methanobacteriota archaeon]
MRIEPIWGERALLLLGNERVMVAGDLHVGLESGLARDGVRIQSQTSAMRERLVQLVEEHGIQRLVLIGDLKHAVASSSFQEERELPAFLDRLAPRVELVPGNHDAALPELPGLVRHPATGTTIEDVGLSHGHAWPTPEVLSCPTVVISHNHPSVLLRDELGAGAKEPCWVRARFRTRGARRLGVRPGARLIVLPAFNELLGGVAFNAVDESPLGPLLTNDLVDLEKAVLTTLDGIDLGTVGTLRRFGSARRVR